MIYIPVPTGNATGALGAPMALSLAALLVRLLLGGFYVLARFRYYFDPSKMKGQRFFNRDRRNSLRAKIHSMGFSVDYVAILADLVAGAEVFGGLLLVFGYLTTAAATTLLGLTLFISYLASGQKIVDQCAAYPGGAPVDAAHVAECYLWRVEGLYIGLALLVLLLGPGAISLDVFLGIG